MSCTISTNTYDAIIFDMDGVVTKTADLHAKAWKRTFDEFLDRRFGTDFQPFDIEDDYSLYIDGKPRYDGVESFLDSRDIKIDSGTTDDAPGFDSICAIGNLKNVRFHELLSKHGVNPYKSTVDMIHSARKLGFKTGIITSSRNGRLILETAQLNELFDVAIDGAEAAKWHLKGKPEPDIFLKAAELLDANPKRTVIVEDAIAGVEGGHNGGFGMVIGVDRSDKAFFMRQRGADAVVHDLEEVTFDKKCSNYTQDYESKNWVLEYNWFSPEIEGRRESLCTLGNGYFFTRGSAPESISDEVHYPATYVAGLYNRLVTDFEQFSLRHEDLVRLPDWQHLKFKIHDGQWFTLQDVELIKYRQRLNIKQGILYRELEFRDRQKRTTHVKERRFVHMRFFHLAGLETEITPIDWSGTLTVSSSLDANIENEGVKRFKPLAGRHLESLENAVRNDCLFLRSRTVQSRIEICQASRMRIKSKNESGSSIDESVISCETSKSDSAISQTKSVRARQGEPITIQKIASLYTSRDRAVIEPGEAALEALDSAPSFEKLLDDQIETWLHLWQRFELELEDVRVTKNFHTALILRLHSFHVLQTASPNSSDLDVGIPARGWTGEGYQGHVFWDELFVFPFLNLRLPAVAEALLLYRYRRLDQARQLATSKGARGACYPWQSASSGSEETPEFLYFPKSNKWVKDHTLLQIHVNAAIAYNIWQYYEITGNLDFISAFGAEMLLEIANFFATYAQFNEQKGRYEILSVVGPDEYHVGYEGRETIGIDNNSYTNLMAAWTIHSALKSLDILPEGRAIELREKLDLADEELTLWRQVSRKMFVPILENGIIDQFEGFSSLDDFPRSDNGETEIDKRSRHGGKIGHDKVLSLLEENGGHLNQYKIAKQADVIMLFYLFDATQLKELFDRLGYDFNKEMIAKNIAYYSPITAHDSTLSRVAEAWVLSRFDREHAFKLLDMSLSDAAEVGTSEDRWSSWNIFLEALSSDYYDIQGGTTPEGIHIGAMAGTVDIVQRCYTGLVFKDGVLWINPHLPKELTRLAFEISYQRQSLSFQITHHSVKILGNHGKVRTVKIGFDKKVHSISGGETLEFKLG